MPEKTRRTERLASGLCTACGVAEHVEGRTKCAACAERARSYAAERREEAARKGLCEACMRRKAAEGRGKRCNACADKYGPSSGRKRG